MNRLFRNIRENTNVDLGEESEDEDIFQNTSLDKYVDLKKEYKMHCVYNAKFKKWAPVRVVDNASRLVSIKELIRQTAPNRTPYQAKAVPYQAKAVPYQAKAVPYQAKAVPKPAPRPNYMNKFHDKTKTFDKKSYKSSYKNVHK
jgi:hypothetical protein